MSELLDEKEIAQFLDSLGGWEVAGGVLWKRFEFENYLDGVGFAVRCAEVAEGMNHHPDLLMQWRKVRVSITTHSAGGLTGLDFEYAGRVERGAAISVPPGS
ncbi:MAG: 4a-hydroxytetrahydrobiopterin dehydratase [Akkermansiaceae bacterium]|jgi:4a-hydroxytetrahydrobiopterin dehydratase